MLYFYETIEEAEHALNAAALDVIADFGEEKLEEGWWDIVNSIAALCSPQVAIKLRTRHL